jgi:aerobic-type carbon monoxide dehydrogenase small subunit (CoxS/CutS family)
MKIAFRLNGEEINVEIEPRHTLAEMLTRKLRLTGTKVSCEAEVCGSCTVLVGGLPVSSCTYLAYEVRGKNVTTIEGLQDQAGRLHPVQQAFIDEFAFQCGYCTPGMILTAKALLDEVAQPTDEQIVAHMDGNLCRCTGYLPIVKAVRSAARSLGVLA